MSGKSAKRLKKGDELFGEIKERMLARLSGVNERLHIPCKPRTRKESCSDEPRYVTAEEFFGG